MAVKTITIKEDAYNVLASMKKSDESFSDLILRMNNKKCTAKDLFGKLKISDADFAELKKHTCAIRKNIGTSMRKKRNVFDRHMCND